MKLEPLADRVVLKQLVAEETTKSGIVSVIICFLSLVCVH